MTKALFQLRRILLTYLGDIEQIKSIASGVGVDLEKIHWQNAAVHIWQEVLNKGLVLGSLDDFLQKVKLNKLTDQEKIHFDRELKFWEETNRILGELPLDPGKMGILDTINCGRKTESEDFWKPSDFAPEERPLLTCLISGRRSDMPSSMAKRLAFEFFSKLPEDQSICYLREGDGISIKPLRLDSNKNIPIHNAIQQYLESFEQACCQCGYDWCTHLVEVDVAACGKMIYKILDIVKEKFRVFSERKELRSLVFITYSFPQTFDSSRLHQHLQDNLKESEPAKYYRITRGVDQQEIKNWFTANGLKPEEDINKYLEPFLTFHLTADQKRAFREEQSLPMNVMEKIQQRIFQVVMNPSERK